MRILIAEDDFTSRIMLAAVLKKNGHEVEATANGQEAWEKMQNPDAPCLAILDWMMPKMDGLDLVRRIRACPTERPPSPGWTPGRMTIWPNPLMRENSAPASKSAAACSRCRTRSSKAGVLWRTRPRTIR